jgi:hypothetical protein
MKVRLKSHTIAKITDCQQTEGEQRQMVKELVRYKYQIDSSDTCIKLTQWVVPCEKKIPEPLFQLKQTLASCLISIARVLPYFGESRTLDVSPSPDRSCPNSLSPLPLSQTDCPNRSWVDVVIWHQRVGGLAWFLTYFLPYFGLDWFLIYPDLFQGTSGHIRKRLWENFCSRFSHTNKRTFEPCKVVYSESRKRELKTWLMNESRCDERLKTRVEESWVSLFFKELISKLNRIIFFCCFTFSFLAHK